MSAYTPPQSRYPDRMTIVAGQRRKGRCGYCKRAVWWVTKVPGSSRTSAVTNVPFDHEPLVLEQLRTDTGIRLEVVARTHIHFDSCPAPRRAHVPRAPRGWMGRR